MIDGDEMRPAAEDDDDSDGDGDASFAPDISRFLL